MNQTHFLELTAVLILVYLTYHMTAKLICMGAAKRWLALYDGRCGILLGDDMIPNYAIPISNNCRTATRRIITSTNRESKFSLHESFNALHPSAQIRVLRDLVVKHQAEPYCVRLKLITRFTDLPVSNIPMPDGAVAPRIDKSF